ncbi:uncharacterized protein LOC102899165 isoform X4 [Felis catus]|uniref:uncharacterized protein LOC102899165 isoform X4 n=1 Tax=Felis catus TaxID=9685 RepID=UPI001D1992D0|nr:uncharacterized protein LOC102899165 isoform X4 [Felis catus]
MPTPAITFGRMEGFLRFGPRSWGGDDSRQHPLTPPRVKLPSPPTPKQSQQRAEPQLLALCWGLEGLIAVLVSQQAKTFPVLLFKLASFPHRTLPLSSGDRCDIPTGDAGSTNDSARQGQPSGPDSLKGPMTRHGESPWQSENPYVPGRVSSCCIITAVTLTATKNLLHDLQSTFRGMKQHWLPIAIIYK